MCLPTVHPFLRDRNKQARWSDVDPEKPGEWQARLAYLAGLLDMPKTDLTEFAARGGKIIIVHGLSDQIVPPKATEDYYERVVAKMGAETVKSFLKFYEVPGTAHSGVGTAFTPTWDALGALDAWASEGKAPVDPIVTDTYAVRAARARSANIRRGRIQGFGRHQQRDEFRLRQLNGHLHRIVDGRSDEETHHFRWGGRFCSPVLRRGRHVCGRRDADKSRCDTPCSLRL